MVLTVRNGVSILAATLNSGWGWWLLCALHREDRPGAERGRDHGPAGVTIGILHTFVKGPLLAGV